ncbi:MFS transporter [Paenibacillus jiagnxiensis]|uniref:MFS transporter n=1 Tax=Paenibacillus jiagnxiensis TaxID=3228926 RepID=UPI0038D3D6CB
MNTMEADIQAGIRLMRVLAFTLVISVMNATMFNIVLPQMKEELGISVTQVSWVFSFYTLFYAVGVAIFGKLADKYSLKSLLTFGLTVLALGSLIGLAAQAFWMVIVGRILQAAGASIIPVMAMLIPIRYFPPENRGRALGISATGLALGNAVGPVVSALVVGAFHWRWLFAIPLLMIFMLPFYRKYLTDEQPKGGRVDWLGGSLLAVSIASCVLAVTQGSWGLGAGSALLLVCFILRVRTAAEPFIQLDLFRNKSYTLGLITAVIVMSIGFSLPYLTPQLLADVQQLSPAWIGFAMVPAALVTALLGRQGGKLADTKGNAFLFTAASLLLLSCFALLALFTGAPALLIACFLIFGTLGQAFMQIALSNTISGTLSRERAGVGMGLLSMINFLSGTISTLIYSKALDHGAGTAWNPFNSFTGTFVFSNIYLSLFALYVVLLVVYRLYLKRHLIAPGQMKEGTLSRP